MYFHWNTTLNKKAIITSVGKITYVDNLDENKFLIVVILSPP